MFWLKNALGNLSAIKGPFRFLALIIVVVLGVLAAPAFIYIWTWFAIIVWVIQYVWIPFYRSMKPISYFAAIFLVFSLIVLFIGVCQGVINAVKFFTWPLVTFWNVLPLGSIESTVLCLSMYLLIGIIFMMYALKGNRNI